MEQRRKVLLSLALVLVTLILYWPVTHYGFVYIDDNLYVTENSRVQQGLSPANVTWAFSNTDAFNWHPITWISHMMDCSIFKLFAGGHHLTNILLHALNTILLFLLLKRLTQFLWPSFIVAALFAWHPLHVESVAWVSERKDVLSTLFLFLTIFAYARYVGSRSKLWYVIALFLFALGLMSKPMLVTAPCILLLLDYWPLRRFPNAFNESGLSPAKKIYFRLFLEKLPFFALSGIASVIAIVAQKNALRNLEDVPYSTRVLNSIISYVDYLWSTLVPENLCVYYPLPAHISIRSGIFSGLILIVISCLAFRNRHKFPWLIMGWLWFLGTLVPVIGLVQVGQQARADRYTYIPLIGLFIAIIWSADFWLQRRPFIRSFGIGASSILLIGCLFATYHQLGYWRDNFSLFTRAIAVTTDNSLCHQNLALAFSHAGKSAEAIEHYKEVLRIKPNKATVRYDLAIELASLGKTDEAITQFSEVLERGSRNEKVYNNLGVLLSLKGDLVPATENFKQAIQLNPNYPDPYMNYAVILQKQGMAEQAATNYTKALQLNPDFPEALGKFAFFLATCPEPKWRNPTAAVKMAEQATKITRHNLVNRLETLAAIYATVGRYSNAIVTAEQARKIALEKKLQSDLKRIARDLELYRAGQSPPRDWKNPL